MEGPVYNTPMNTLGVGDPVPFGVTECGSGDIFGYGPAKPKKFGKGKKGHVMGMATKQPAPMFGDYGMKPRPLFVPYEGNEMKRTKK